MQYHTKVLILEKNLNNLSIYVEEFFTDTQGSEK